MKGFKKEFLELLEDNDVVEKICSALEPKLLGRKSKENLTIRDCADIERYHRLEEENRNLKERNDTLEEQRRTSELKFKDLENECEEQKQEINQKNIEIKQLTDALNRTKEDVCACEKDKRKLEEAIQKSNSQAAEIKEKMNFFTELYELYNQYCMLDEVVTKPLITILRADNPITFMVCGCQENNIMALWQYIKSEYEKLGAVERKLLFRILRYFIDKVNLLYREPMYMLMENEQGCMFDDSRHMRTSDSRLYSGTIKEVLLPGIWNCYKQEAICKCVVRV